METTKKKAPGTLMLWAKAAESLRDIAGTAVEETVQQVLHHRSLRQQQEGLRQYLSIRLGSTELGERAFADLKRSVAEWTTERLVTAPGPRAQLYGFARALAYSWPATRGTVKHANLPWRDLQGEGRTLYAVELGRVREALDGSTREIAELRFARGLGVDEIAFVCEMTESEVDEAIQRARDVAHTFLGTTPPSLMPGLDGALLEALSLEPAITSAERGPFEAKSTKLEPGTVLGGRYRIEERAGTGSFGDVYRAMDEDVPGHVVALKLLHQPALTDVARAVALRELRHLASVFHPSVVQFKDHGWNDGRLWFVMPWYSGETLEKRIRQSAMTRKQARQIFEPLAQGLAAIHAAGLRHQDIKPDNIFLATMGNTHEVLPVLIDFGVSAAASELVFAGTPQYFAPEVAAQFGDRGPKRPISGAADVFALALALRNTLEPETAEPVPPSAFDAFIDRRATTAPTPPTAKQFRYLESYFKRWLSLNPHERPTAEEFARELAVLTAPEEARARRHKTLRWLVPTILGLGTAFGAALYVANHNAELQRLRAEQAQTETSLVREDLRQSDARRRALIANVNELQGEIESNQLTRAQLVNELNDSRTNADALREELVRADRTERALRTELETTTTRATTAETDLSATRTSLAGEMQRARMLETDGARLRQQLSQTETALNDARAAEAELSRELGAARLRSVQLAAESETHRGQAQAAESRVRELERRIAHSETTRAELENQIAELRRELARAHEVRTPSAPEATAPTPSQP